MSSKLIRWGGIAGIGSGLMSIASAMTVLRYGDSLAPGAPGFLMYEAFYGAAPALAVVTLLAIREIHRRYGRGLGRIGTAGFALTLIGSVLLALKQLLVLALTAVGAEVPFIVWPLFMVPASVGGMIGPVLLGIGILRAGVMPRWFGVLWTLSVPLMLATNAQGYGGFTQGAISIVLGFALLIGQAVKNPAPAPSAG